MNLRFTALTQFLFMMTNVGLDVRAFLRDCPLRSVPASAYLDPGIQFVTTRLQNALTFNLLTFEFWNIVDYPWSVIKTYYDILSCLLYLRAAYACHCRRNTWVYWMRIVGIFGLAIRLLVFKVPDIVLASASTNLFVVVVQQLNLLWMFLSLATFVALLSSEVYPAFLAHMPRLKLMRLLYVLAWLTPAVCIALISSSLILILTAKGTQAYGYYLYIMLMVGVGILIPYLYVVCVFAEIGDDSLFNIFCWNVRAAWQALVDTCLNTEQYPNREESSTFEQPVEPVSELDETGIASAQIEITGADADDTAKVTGA